MAKPHTAPAWRRAFLSELARSGSVTLAAAAVGIDRSSAYQARRKNPALAASWERALASARGVLRPFDGLRAQDERVLGAPTLREDEVVRASKAGRPCVVRAGPGRWSVAGERRFLAELTATANVKAAARAAGVSAVAAYNRRRLWPAFAAAWDAARAEGYVRLEMALLHAATATLDPEPEAGAVRDDAFAGPEMSVDQAMRLLFHRDGAQGARGGRGRGYGWRAQESDIEAVRVEVLRRLTAIRKARGIGARLEPDLRGHAGVGDDEEQRAGAGEGGDGPGKGPEPAARAQVAEHRAGAA